MLSPPANRISPQGPRAPDLSLQSNSGLTYVDSPTTTPDLSMQASSSGRIAPSDSRSPSHSTTGVGMFNQASGFRIDNSSFVDVIGNADFQIHTGNSQAAQTYINVDGGAKFDFSATVANNRADSILEKKRMPGAEFDSSDRYPPPKCYKSTRKKIRETIWKWLDDDNRESNMFWVIGGAGVGKSAVAQTVIEKWDEEGESGASYFFSRPNHRDDPSTVVPTLVYRLIRKNSDYKALIEQLLGDDPSLLEKDIQTQFNRLIVTPFQILHADKRCGRPLLIVLDGLDECAGREYQRLFIRTISDCAKSRSDSPVLWLVLSRPEWHLKRLFENTIASCRSELSADQEARDDVREFLRDEFRELRQQLAGLIPSNISEWPTQDQISQLSHAASGLFVIASTTLRFIEHGTKGNPVTRLQLCIDFVTRIPNPRPQSESRAGRSTTMDGINPLDALDYLYRQILEDCSTDNQTMMDIMCLRILYPDSNLSVRLHSDILELDQSSFLSALLGVHSVLLVPPPEYVDKHGIFFHHASFADFLQDPRRSDRFHTLFKTACSNVAICCLRWYNAINITRCSSNSGCDHTLITLPLTWPLPNNDPIDAILAIVGKMVWTACCLVTNDAQRVLAELRQFSFCHLELSARSEPQFVQFLTWLYGVDNHRDILRTMPGFSVADLQLAWEMRLKLSFSVDSLLAGQPRIEIISLSPRKKPSMKKQSSAFLLGVKKNVCLVRVLPQRTVHFTDNLDDPEMLLNHVHTICRLDF